MKKGTTSVLLWEPQHQLIQFAATKENMNVSEFMREVVIPFVAQRCGRPVPNVPKIERALSRAPGTSESGMHAIDPQALAKAIVEQLQKVAAAS